MAEIWTRPWALYSTQHRHSLQPGEHSIPANHRGPLWLYARSGGPLGINGRSDAAEPVAGFTLDDTRSLGLMPLALKRKPGATVADAHTVTRILWNDAPEKLSSAVEPRSDDEQMARNLFLRAETVWDRLAELETALSNPIILWLELRRRWTDEQDDAEPRMDVIVRQARRLGPILEALDRAPRRILRRSHHLVPVARVQEMDRRAMTWLIRRPGESLAERAGDDQRILAVVREQNFDTLENRVLRAYAELARSVARDYRERNQKKKSTRRYRLVSDFEKRSRRLSRDFAKRGVRRAAPGVTPNFVLLENPRYRQIWRAWQELIQRADAEDEIWRWQARSWEEFAALAVMVALQGVTNARLVAASPVSFLDEQRRGSWIDHDNPLGAFHLPDQGLVVEVQYRLSKPGQWRADLAAPVWIKYGRTNDPASFHKFVAVWPVWDPTGGLVSGEATEVAGFLPRRRREGLNGAVILRPTSQGEGVKSELGQGVVALTCGAQGTELRDALAALTSFLADLMNKGI